MKAILLAVTVLASGAAFAQDAPKPHALVHADAGSVVVGNSEVAVDASAGANAGDTVNVAQGQATVTYDNGCSVTVTSSYVIEQQAPNCKGAVPLDSDGKYVALGVLGAAVVIGGVAGGGGGDHDDTPSSP